MILPTLTGKLINLRPIAARDKESLCRYANDPKVAYFLPRMPNPYTARDAAAWIRESARLARENSGYHFAIALAEYDELIGVIGLRNIKISDRKGELGFWLARKFWNRGYTSEAVDLILRFAFGKLKFKRVHALVHERNLASIRILEKFGFTREAVYRKASFKGRRWADIYGYGLLKEEYQ